MNTKEKQKQDAKINQERRDFIKQSAAIGGAALLASSSMPSAFAMSKLHQRSIDGKKTASDIFIGTRMNNIAPKEHFEFLSQLGVKQVRIDIRKNMKSYDELMKLREKVNGAGIEIFSAIWGSGYKGDLVGLGLPGRDEVISEYQQFIRDLGKAGIKNTGYSFYSFDPVRVFSTGTTITRGARARTFNLGEARKIVAEKMPEKKYSAEEVWENHNYFIQKIMPVCEEAGVRIALHPDDPPIPDLGSVARIFSRFEGFKRAIEVADSPNYGLIFCIGCWSEGGETMGIDMFDAIRYFGKRNKIFSVHFRNVTAPLPEFTETFLNAGYVDMYKVMKTFKEVNFQGLMVPDHVPKLINDPDRLASNAYTIGYMQALLQAAEAEVLS